MAQINYSKYPIAIYDDEPSIMELLQDMLVPQFKVYLANSISDLKNQFEEKSISILIIDYHLGEKTGLEVIKELETSETKIIMISGDKSRKLLETAINQNDISGFITKPFSLTDVREIVKNQYEIYTEVIKQKSIQTQYEQQAKRYQEEVSMVNETLFETLVTSHSNYRVADRLASLIDSQLEFVVERARINHDKKQISEMLMEVKTLVSSIHSQFSIDRIVVLDAILSILIKIMYNPKIDQIIELEEYIKSNLTSYYNSEDEDNSVKSQLNYFLANLKTSITKEDFSILTALEELSSLKLAYTLVNEFLQTNELPNPTVHFVLIINEDKPIFKWSETIEYDLSLASNFIVALDSFSQEMLRHGEIKTIQLERAVMMVRQSEEITFCCLVDYETLEIRMRFESFITSVKSRIKQQPSNISLDEDEIILEHLMSNFKKYNA